MRKLSYIFILALSIVSFNVFCANLKIVASNYPAYDLSRAVVGDCGDVLLLLKPGTDAHMFEPTPKDVSLISKADLFVYTGGENDVFLDRILDSLDDKPEILSMLKAVNPLEVDHSERTFESSHKGHHHGEFDEHVWTSYRNDILILKAIAKKLSEISPENKEIFEKNANAYIDEFSTLDKDTKNLIENAPRKTIVFADRFPFLYFAHDYNLDFYAAFSGCSENTEASATTVAKLIDTVKKKKIPAVFSIEFSNEKLSSVLHFNSCHNISPSQYKDKVKMTFIMRKNLEALKQALYDVN